MIIDHIGTSISDYDRSKEFYEKSLAPLGIELIIDIQGWAGDAARFRRCQTKTLASLFSQTQL
jgi:catechol 2,3-dioxygenase-like lactoylglutathione lyase family enzyme